MLTLFITALILCALLHTQRRHAAPATPSTLLTEPRQCLHGFKRLANARHKAALEQWHSINLPALTKEDRL